jgi:tetratricopeptide (TPR) repeat protein
MFERLKAMQASGTIDAAEATFRRILDSTPDHLHAQLGLGYCLSLAGDAAGAVAAFEAAAALGTMQEDAAIDCAKALSHVGAVEQARRVLRGQPPSVRQHMALGEIEDRHGDLNAALACYEAAAALDPDADLPLRAMIDLHRRRAAFAPGHAAIDRLAALDPKHEAAAWHYRGRLHRAANDTDAAIAALARSVALAPKPDQPAIDLSQALQAAGREGEAHALLAGRPPSYAVLLALGDIALAARDHAAALRHLEDAQALEPKRPEALARAARVEADRNRFDLALAYADRIEALGPEHRLAAARSRIGSFKAAADETAALKTLEQMVTLAPADAGLRAELARQYRLTGDAVKAKSAVQAALARDRRSLAGLAEAMDQALAIEDRETALGLCRRMVEMAPDHAGHHLRLARLLHDVDHLDEARGILARTEARFGRFADLWGERIRLLRESGQNHAALDEARQAHAAFPTHFRLWSDRFGLEVRLSSLEEVALCIRAAPCKTRDQEADLCLAEARLAERRQDPEAAIAHLEAGLRIKTHQRGILVLLFEVHIRNGDVAQAATYFARLAALQAPDRRMRRASTNASQSMYGQLLNEFTLDRRAMAELATARKPGVPAEEVEAVIALVKKRPDHIPTAFALVAALRRGGWFNRPRRDAAMAAGALTIPQVIGQFWDKPQPSDELLHLSATWRRHNSGYRHYLFNVDTAWAYLKRYFPPAVLAAFRRCLDPTTQADVFRLAFLLRDGGIWADMDDRCVAPMAGLIPADAEAFFRQENVGSLGNNLMAAAPGHPIIRRALVAAVQAINRGDRDKVWMLTGPGLITRAFAGEMAESDQSWPDWLDRVAVADEYDLFPFVAVHCRTSHKRLGENWVKTAFSRRRPQTYELGEGDGQFDRVE